MQALFIRTLPKQVPPQFSFICAQLTQVLSRACSFVGNFLNSSAGSAQLCAMMRVLSNCSQFTWVLLMSFIFARPGRIVFIYTLFTPNPTQVPRTCMEIFAGSTQVLFTFMLFLLASRSNKFSSRDSSMGTSRGGCRSGNGCSSTSKGKKKTAKASARFKHKNRHKHIHKHRHKHTHRHTHEHKHTPKHNLKHKHKHKQKHKPKQNQKHKHRHRQKHS